MNRLYFRDLKFFKLFFVFYKGADPSTWNKGRSASDNNFKIYSKFKKFIRNFEYLFENFIIF